MSLARSTYPSYLPERIFFISSRNYSAAIRVLLNSRATSPSFVSLSSQEFLHPEPAKKSDDLLEAVAFRCFVIAGIIPAPSVRPLYRNSMKLETSLSRRSLLRETNFHAGERGKREMQRSEKSFPRDATFIKTIAPSPLFFMFPLSFHFTALTRVVIRVVQRIAPANHRGRGTR